MKRNSIKTYRLWRLFFILAVFRVTGSSSKTIDQVKLPIPTKESLPQVAEVLKAASYLEDDDELENNFEGSRNTYKRSPRKLGTDDLDKNSEPQEYQGVVGRPGVDFPILPSIPHTDFSCKKVKKPGYYADPETDCQVFHICDNGRKVSFLCPNGTVFRQSHLICDWWFRVDCERSIELYEESAEQLATDQKIFKERSEALAKAMLKVQTTPSINGGVVTERSFGPSTTIFNSESRLPERARYFNGYSRDESQVPAETGSFAGNQYQTNFNNFYQQSKTSAGNWNQSNFQASNYQTQYSTTSQPSQNQAVNTNYQIGSYQTQSSTIPQPFLNQGINNDYQSGFYQTQSSITTQPSRNQFNNNNYQSSFYQTQFLTTPQPIWNHNTNYNQNKDIYRTQSSTTAQSIRNQMINNNNYRNGLYQPQSSTNIQPIWNKAVSNDYQTQSSTTPQPFNIQEINNFQTSDQPKYSTSAQSIKNQDVTSSQISYQHQPTTIASKTNWNQDNNNYRSENYQTQSTTAATETNWNNQGTNSFRTENDQSYNKPSTTQINLNEGGIYQPVDYQTPPTISESRSTWNNQDAKNFQTENYQTIPTTTPTSIKWNNQGVNDFGTVNDEKPVTATVAQTNWNQAIDNLSSNNYQSLPVTTVQPEWIQESDTVQPSQYQTQQPTTIFPIENDHSIQSKESQVPAESASFISNQNPLKFNFQQENYYTQTPQTNPPQTTYPVTSSYINDYSPNGAFSFVDYQMSPNPSVAKDSPTEATPITTTILDYTTVSNSTLPPSGETLIPNMINSLQTLTDNNILFDLDGQNAYPSQINTNDELNSVALYFNNMKNPQVTTIASDLQFNYVDQTIKSYMNGVSPVGINSVEAKTQVVDDLHIPAVLTQNTKEAYDKLFKNDSNVESVSSERPTETNKTTTNSSSSVNLSFTQGLKFNHSSAELRELAAVFTRALTAYLDDPENFRKILAEVRPTEPPSVKSSIPEEQEVLDFSDDLKSRRNKLTETTTKKQNLASEINSMTQRTNGITDLSTIVPQYTTSPLTEITSKFTETTNNEIHEYAPPEESEQLQVAGSQSFYSSRYNSIENSKTLKPATSTLTWTVSPLINTEQDIKVTTLPPVYFTTTVAENLETTVIVQRAKEMFSHLNESDAGLLMNVMKTSQANDTVKRLVLLLVNDPNKENSPEQTRNNIIEALLDNKSTDQEYASSTSTSTFLPSSTPGIPFGQRLQDDGTPILDGQHKKIRKATRRRVVHRSRSIFTSTTPITPNTLQGANDVRPELSADSDARAVELLKSLYSIASKWS